MGKQTRFFVSDINNVRIVAEKIIEMKFEIVDRKYDADSGWHYSHTLATMDNLISHSVLIKLFRPEYSLNNSIYTPYTPQIEWLKGTVVSDKKKILRSRIFLDTEKLSQCDMRIQELVKSDYLKICNAVNKAAPIRTVLINGETIKQRMDEQTIRLLQDGYSISFW